MNLLATTSNQSFQLFAKLKASSFSIWFTKRFIVL